MYTEILFRIHKNKYFLNKMKENVFLNKISKKPTENKYKSKGSWCMLCKH